MSIRSIRSFSLTILVMITFPFIAQGGIRPAVADAMEELYFKIKSQKIATRIDSIFCHLHTKSGFNGVVLISEKQHVIYKKAFGFADLKSKSVLNTKSAFQLASVSKQFTAVAIMMLMERGYLSYEDKVTRFYPNFPYGEITIRQLLTHRAGLADYRWFCDPLLPDKTIPLSNQEMMRLFEVHRPPTYFNADSRFAYSNTGYAVLAAIVEKISGVKFSQFMRKAIFEPLNMYQTSVYSKCEAASTPGEVIGYERNGQWQAPNDCFNGITGDKNVYSTVDDLSLWDEVLYTEKLLKQSTLLEAYQPANTELKGWRNYGFGWRINTLNPNKKIVYHSGWWRGFRTFFLRNVSDRNSIIILSNTVNYSLNSLGYLYTLIRENDLDALNESNESLIDDSM
jgi:CubicO group peptidase (beta-lactamase class C family)